ncbi:hypothetical protein [Halomonas sp. HAL1]|uniref:hypothetical protein n=1 Tax=Halomonas sp. HAL1 TaxID=550984 RepID=UPI00022D3352|nr:hypothetical protein [Halomonas sp. HAL1]EHA17348.1 hypothetical protein HAL1_01773 [Halomonas sp. HAL1]WKV91421.1 hypothetical protein Q3Y66_11035 [Halomonas sp. HAL1]
MTNEHFLMLIGAAAYSLVSMIIIYLVALFALTLFLKPKPGIMRLIVGFVACWAVISFYIPFKSLSYYMEHSEEMYIAQLVISVVVLFAVTKLSLTKAPPSDTPET